MPNLFEFDARTLEGKDKSLDEYQGKVVLVVNTASQCGFTPQYAGLQKLYDQYHDKGLEILGFPCDQFGHQEPGDESAIGAFCTKNYGVSFPMFSKVDVNGANAHPIYAFLRKAKGGLVGNRIKWNFTKFLVNKDGKPVKRYGSITKPEKLAGDIEKLLASN
ncbi:MAG: glutathione peroxidase [Actinobacteria bacterium]|nr:glutathione peroxidase [Actinomycetota bacterium]